MSADSIDPVPLRDDQGWTSSARRQPSAQLRSKLEQVATRRDLARLGSEYLRELLKARSASVTTLEDGHFNELMSVGPCPRQAAGTQRRRSIRSPSTRRLPRS